MKKKILTFAGLIVVLIASAFALTRFGGVQVFAALTGQGDIGPEMFPIISRDKISSIALEQAMSVAEEDSKVSQQVKSPAWQKFGVRGTKSVAEFRSAVEIAAPGSAIYVDRKTLAKIDDSWMQAQYKRGVVFIGVGVPLSALTKKLGVEQTVPDLNMAFANGKTQVAMVYDYKFEGGGMAGQLIDFVSDLDSLPEYVVRQITSHRKA